MQLWSLTLGSMVDSLPCGDSVLCATTIPRRAAHSLEVQTCSHIMLQQILFPGSTQPSQAKPSYPTRRLMGRSLIQSRLSQNDSCACRSAWVLIGLESGSLGALSASTASGQLLQGVGNVGAVNMLPYEGEAT